MDLEPKEKSRNASWLLQSREKKSLERREESFAFFGGDGVGSLGGMKKSSSALRLQPGDENNQCT